MTARTARLPFDHLIAEIAAFPLSSEAALANPVSRLCPADKQTQKLWQEAERALIPAAPGISLDELAALRNQIWFGPDLTPQSLQDYLRRTTARYLETLGAGLGPRIPITHSGPLTRTPCTAEARLGWMWLTFALPDDLLLAANTPQPSAPDLISPPVRNLLRRGFTESHLHFKASLDFADVWALTIDRIADATATLPDLGARACCLADGKGLLDWLVRMAAARFLLAQFLVARRTETFAEFLDDRMRAIAGQRIGPADYSLLLQAVDDLRRGTLSTADRTQIRIAYAHLVSRSGAPATEDLDDVPRLDPLHALLARSRTGNADQRYVRKMCDFLDTSADELAGQVFWQTVRIRAMLYRYITQRPLTPGLAWFIRFFGRMSKVRGTVTDPVMIKAAQRRSGIEDGLASLELRTAPPGRSARALELTQTVDQIRRQTRIEHALVIHFVKSRPQKSDRPYNTYADPHPEINPTGYRFARYYERELKNAASLADVLHRSPRTQFVLRGLDICSDELAVPTWVMKPLVKYVRKAARNGARYLHSQYAEGAPMLRTTVHAGEDFAHLLTGLRNVHEAVEMLDLREGDRIGHGLALGVDARAWAERVGRVAMPLEDRVFDLTWEWVWWSRRGAGSDGARLAYLTRELGRLSREWFGTEMSAAQLEKLRDDLTDPAQLRAAGFPEGKSVTVRRTDLWKYLTRQEIFERGRETLWIETAGEAEAVERISLALRDEISRRGLAIEVNPTSNLLIGDLRDLATHPLWRLAPPRPRPDLPPLAVTIGSDDPLVFNCRLPSEYQLLFDSLVLAGLTDTEALDWLERARQHGMERRFSTQIPCDDFELLGVENPEIWSRFTI